MGVSVIIPTYNGAHKLPHLLQALKSQTFKRFQIVVVVDGSTDNTGEVLQAFSSSFLYFKVITQENRGRAVVRNAGAAAANGGLLVFFDDDMIPGPNCLQVHVDHHRQISRSILTGAQIDLNDSSGTDVQRFKYHLSHKWGEPMVQKTPFKKDQLYLTAANFSIRKEDFEKLGRFDERLNDAEDFDLAVRAYKAGIRLYFNYQAFAWHNDKITCQSYIKRQREYSKAQEKLKQLNPWIEKEGFVKPPEKPVGLKKYFFLLFCTPFWIKMVDKEYLKLISPQPFRYKLYDFIITANGVYFPDKVSL